MKGNTRRSSRSLKQNIENAHPRSGRSRSTSANENALQRRSIKTTSEIEKSSPRKRKRSVSSPVEVAKVLKRTVDGRVIDAYCWVCHKLGSESICSSCPRVYHKDCLKKLKGNSNQSPSCECQLRTVDGKNENLNLDVRELKKLLQYVMQEAIKEDKKNNQKSQRTGISKFCRLFQAWPMENESFCKIMDLNILIDNMNGEEPYLSTGQFFLDVKWIYHNCCILYGPDYEITEAALKLEKNFKLELTDVEACPECYSSKYSDNYLHADFFTKVCRKPHPIVWAKLRGSPFWPAKCLKIHSGHVDVRFFATHDKSNIAIDKCFRISRENPLNKAIHQTKYKEAIRELSVYVSNYENMIGPFQFYPQKTCLEDVGNISTKKSYRRGRHKVNIEPVSRNEPFHESENAFDQDNNGFNKDPTETKVKASFSYLRNFTDNENNENIAESVAENLESNVVCHMTFTADEHNGPANELNNADEFMDNSTPHLSQASLNPNLTLTVEETSSLLSSAGVLPQSGEFMTSTEAEQNSVGYLNVTALPVITSVTASEVPVASDEISSNVLSDGSSSSSTLPVITSTISTSEKADFVTKDILDAGENTKVSLTNPLAEGSSSIPAFTRGLYNSLINDVNFSSLFENADEPEDEIQVISEEKKKALAEDYLNNPSILRAFSGILFNGNQQFKENFLKFHSQILRYFVLLWIEISFSKFDTRDVKMFLELCKKYVKKNDILKKALSKAEADKVEAEKAKIEAEKVRSDLEKALSETENAKSEMEKELKELRKKVEIMGQGQIPNQKSELKDMIILKASQKIQNRNDGSGGHRKKSEGNLIQEIDSLSMQLEEARQKIIIKEEDICKLREENERLKSSSNSTEDKIGTSDSEVQTEESHFNSPDKETPEPDSVLAVNHNLDSFQLTRKNVQSHNEDPFNSQELQSFTQTDTIQTECTALMANSTAGVITAPTPELMSVPVVLPPHTVVLQPNSAIPPSGRIISDAEASDATYLSSLNSRKCKSKPSNQTKTSGKRKKKNV